MTDAQFLLMCIRAKGINPSEQDGKLVLEPGGLLDEAETGLVKAHRDEILRELYMETACPFTPS